MSKVYEEEKRFVLVNNNGEVSILDTNPEVEGEGNLLVFSMDCVSIDAADLVTEELYALIRLLNEQDEEIKGFADKKNLDEYRYITELEKENQILKNQIVAIVGLSIKIEDYINDIKIIANHRGKTDRRE